MELAQGRAPPQRQPRGEMRERGDGVTAMQGREPVGHQLGEAIAVQLVVTEPQDVPAGLVHHAGLTVRPERPQRRAQFRHPHMDHRRCARRRLVAPQRLDKATGGYDAVGVEQQHGQQSSVARTAHASTVRRRARPTPGRAGGKPPRHPARPFAHRTSVRPRGSGPPDPAESRPSGRRIRDPEGRPPSVRFRGGDEGQPGARRDTTRAGWRSGCSASWPCIAPEEPIAHSTDVREKVEHCWPSWLWRAGSSVTIDRIIEALWSHPPRRSRQNVATLVSRLRGDLGRAAVLGGPARYRLAPTVDVDLYHAADPGGPGRRADG